MGLSRVPDERMLFYDGTLTTEEKGRVHPCTKAKCVMRPGDSPPPVEPSIPSGYDIPDDASVIKKSPAVPEATITATSVKYLRDPESAGKSDIEEAAVVPIVYKTLPSPEAQPEIEQKNGIERKLIEEKKLVHDPDDDPCIVKCVYFAQQCCECTIL